MQIFCSTIIPTVNRSTLFQVVRSVLDQDFCRADFEVIVVNDSGQPLPDADWQHSERVRVITTDHRERSVARNTGAAIARGRYLHFLDDDDLLLPGAFEAFWRLDQETDATWLYGSYQTVDNNGNLIEQICPETNGNNFALVIAGEAIPFQVSLLQAKQFFAVGLFDPNPGIIGVEDRDLGRRMALRGTVAYTPAVVARIRIGQQGSTTNWLTLAESDRLGREKALSTPNAFARLQASANTCSWHGQIRQAYWHGRVTRAYIASTLWNLQQKNLFIAASRATVGLAFAGWHILSLDFWRGLWTKIR